ncbi:DegT/DnrJ/EryC1/StrS family aminotransferase [Acetoanaerobium sticklandii]|uniref:DegT/DnrJ/EryC1/StrS family aminotransferase n=1 Tax=Acetoanaerobium sticklandii TaxID=1511 RepID=UPI003A954D52
MEISFNRLDRGYKKYKSEYDNAVIDTLESGHYILGSRVKKFEVEFSDYLDIKYCVALNSGLDALILAFRALGIGHGDEVIVPANTYIASVIGITENGATPIFVEPDEYYNIDANKIEEKITDKTRAILVVHLFGQAAEMSKIKDISIKHNLFLVEDCAQSHGAISNEFVTGTWGDIGCFSFYPTKNLGAFGDAGAIVTNNEKIFEKIKMMRNYGSRIKYQHEIVGINSRMDEIQAALLSVKLKHYKDLRTEREDIALKFLEGINNSAIELPKIREGLEHVWHLFVVRTNERNHFQNYLQDNGISTQVHYPIPIHLSEAYAYLGHMVGSYPIAEYYSEHMISLPLYEGMAEDEIQYVIDVINQYKET